MESMKKVREISSNPQNIGLLVMGLLGSGGITYMLAPVVAGITDRQDVTNVILCTDTETGVFDEKCLKNAKNHVMKMKLILEFEHGGHH